MFPTNREPDDVAALLKAADKDVYRDSEGKDWRSYDLDQPRFTCWAVDQAQGLVGNGGFQYFFEGDWPENPPYSVFIEAYRRIGAKEAADCFQDAVDDFPFADPHLDVKARNAHLDAKRSKPGEFDSLIDRLGDRVIDLNADTLTKLAGYVREHLDSFPAARAHLVQIGELKS
jgi:hypothetical protein